MVKHSVIGQLDLFNVENFNTIAVASNFDMGLNVSDISTRSKASLRPHKRPQIKRETLARVSVKLSLLPSLS